MADAPFVVPPAPKKPVGVTAYELFYAVRAYLEQVHNVRAGQVYFESNGGGVTVTIGTLTHLPGSAQPLARSFRFDLDSNVRTEGSRIGAGPFVLEVKGWCDGKATLLCDVVAVVGQDKSFAFHPVKKREGSTVHY